MTSLKWLHLKFIVRIRLKMILQILLTHIFRHLPNCGVEITSRPKIPPPISPLQMRKLLEQSICRIAFDTPHNLAGCHTGRSTHQNMHMNFANTAHNLYFKRLTDLANHCSKSFSNVTCQNFIAVFCHSNKVILNLKNRMTTIPVVHRTPKNMSF